MSQQPQAQCLPEQGDTSLCLPKGKTRHQPCREPRTVRALIPTSCSCTLGSVSAENTTEQTRPWSDSRALSSGERGTESLPAPGCHCTATTTAPDKPFLGPCWLTPNHAKSLGHSRGSHMQPPRSVSFPSLSVHRKGGPEPAAPWDTVASRGTSKPHLLPHVPTSAPTPGSPTAFPRLSSSGCSTGTQKRNPDDHHCWDTATPQPSAAETGAQPRKDGHLHTLLPSCLPEPAGTLSPTACYGRAWGDPHLRVLGVLLQQQGHDVVGDAVVSAEGGTRCCLQKFGTWPHQLHVGLAQMVPTI